MRVSGNVASGALKVTGNIANSLASKIKSSERGKAAINGHEDHLEQAQKVLAGGLTAFENVFSATKNAAMELGSSAADATVKLTTHKYGEEAGSATRQGADIGL